MELHTGIKELLILLHSLLAPLLSTPQNSIVFRVLSVERIRILFLKEKVLTGGRFSDCFNIYGENISGIYRF